MTSRREPDAIKEAWRIGLEQWWPTVQGLRVPIGCMDGSLAGYAYVRNEKESSGWETTIRDLPFARRVLVIGGGPSAGLESNVVRAVLEGWDLILCCKNHLHEVLGMIGGAQTIVVDGEIDANWQIQDYPRGLALPVVWNCCIMRLDWCDPERIYWASWKPGSVAETFPKTPQRIPYRTSAEGAMWLAVEKCQCSKLGVLGVEVFSEKYRQLRADVLEILELAQRRGVEVMDFSGTGIVAQWCSTQWRKA